MEYFHMMTEQKSLRLIAAGDLLIHDACIDSAYDAGTKSYNFKPMFQYVKDIIKSSDIAICNLETTISGKTHNFSGYPEFNAPEELLEAVRDCGFSLISTANNHSVDFGEQGILATIAAIQKNQMRQTGTSDSADPAIRNVIIECRNIKIGINSYTYGTNEHPVPQERKWLINMIDFNLIENDVNYMRDQGAEIIAICLHAGEEYLTMPDKDQIFYVNKLRKLGVDLIFGNHPHIVQPAIEDPEGKSFTIYSIGNLLSNQRDPLRDTGVILDLEITKKNNHLKIAKIQYHPTYVHRWEQNGKFEFRIIPLEKYWELGAELPAFPFKKAREMLDHIRSHLLSPVNT